MSNMFKHLDLPGFWYVCAFEAYSTKEIDKLNEQRQRLANQSHAAQGKDETPAERQSD